MSEQETWIPPNDSSSRACKQAHGIITVCGTNGQRAGGCCYDCAIGESGNLHRTSQSLDDLDGFAPYFPDNLPCRLSLVHQAHARPTTMSISTMLGVEETRLREKKKKNVRPCADDPGGLLGSVIILEALLALLERCAGEEFLVDGADDGPAIVQRAPEDVLVNLVIERRPGTSPSALRRADRVGIIVLEGLGAAI